MTARAMATRARSAVTSLVRRDVRADRRRTACHDRGAQWPAWPPVPSAVIPARPVLRRWKPQHVPDAAQGVDQPGLLGVDLAPQHGYVGLDDAGVAAEV